MSQGLDTIGNTPLIEADPILPGKEFARSLVVCRDVGDPKGEILACSYCRECGRSPGDSGCVPQRCSVRLMRDNL
jgi:hypothetical protein